MNLLAVSLDHPAKYISWGSISISVPNLIMIIVLAGFFVLALALPFPNHRKR